MALTLNDYNHFVTAQYTTLQLSSFQIIYLPLRPVRTHDLGGFDTENQLVSESDQSRYIVRT